MAFPITIAEILEARERLRPYLAPTAFRNYPELDDHFGNGTRIFVKHENHLPTNAFKVRNALSMMTALGEQEKKRGVVAATRGNHGLAVAYAGKLLGIPATICVPLWNNPEKNSGIRSLGARLIERGRDYDESVAVMQELVRTEGLVEVHSTNHPRIIAGAGTLALEIVEEKADLDVLLVAIGGGSQAVGAMTVARALSPGLQVIGVQAAGASATHDSWHAKTRLSYPAAKTFADGLATRTTYDVAYPALQEGLADFITVTDAEIAEALRLVLSTTHNLVEGSGATGLAGAWKLRDRLRGQSVGIVLSGANIDRQTLQRVLTKDL